MTVLCEVVTSQALAESSTPAVGSIATLVSTANAAAPLVAGIVLAFIGSAAATSIISSHVLTIADDAVVAASFIQGSTTSTYECLGAGVARSTVAVGPEVDVVSTAAGASSTAFAFAHLLVSSAAVAESQCVINIDTTTIATSTGGSRSSLVFGGLEAATSAANAVSAAVGTRYLSGAVSDTVAATSAVFISSAPRANVAVSVAAGSSSVVMQAALQGSLSSTAAATAWVWYKDPNRVAWVLNTETSAASWYNNFDFESVTQVPGKELAVGPDGLYVLSGATDAGEIINASLVSGFDDFGTPQTKRLDTMYFGYTSSGQLSVGVETYGSGHAPYVYYLEARAADAPRNSRVTPGKGLVGRYWRTTIRNIAGAEFHVYNVTSDIATSVRRL